MNTNTVEGWKPKVMRKLIERGLSDRTVAELIYDIDQLFQAELAEVYREILSLKFVGKAQIKALALARGIDISNKK